ncbi:TlpA disulfide reductase family protein [Paucibacter sp. PLA-PC-4]|uniref:TlpA family protein disulfide reductase n=1 Tax=Paucibacter sp. PLA-PC-4 TaxID=2993655 RepID=UPI0022493AB1|nr:TlpA disulfide reductase family protein [Paucibacter sp. PLA-PC-4]MCX2862767.1 TlpA disulfide reductase family protein [Paucibacter sp. PLA-PC-4]
MKRRDLLTLAAATTLPFAAVAEALRRPWPKGQATPPLTLPGFESPARSLAEVKGRPVLLNFWASWCEPCRAEMPSLELLAQRHEADGLLVLAVNHRETDAAIRRFLQAMPISLPIARDADGATSRSFGVRIFPTSVLIARDGRAAFSVIGELDWTGAQARQWIAPLL